MKAKNIVRTLTLLIALGTAVLFVARPDAQTTEDPWQAWVDEQTEAVLKSAGELDAARLADMRDKIRAKFSSLADELKNEVASPPQTEAYARLQTVKQLQDAYDADYNRRHQNTTISVTYKAGKTEILAYDRKILLTEVDSTYPRDAWLQMLLDKGVTIKTSDAYWEYLFLRDALMHIERQPEIWSSGIFGIPPTKDWDTYKTAYIERELGRIQKRLKKKPQEDALHRALKDFERLQGKNWERREVFRHLIPELPELPKLPKLPKLRQGDSFVLRHYGGPQTVKALRDAYDEQYYERYAMTSGSVTYKLNGDTVFEYQTPLPMSEVDAKYPRNEWLQMLLDKGITIDNFEEYWAYLSQREPLVQIEKQPEIWSSGLFGIPPTEEWDTYKAAYLKQRLTKDHGTGDGLEIGHLRKAEAFAEEIKKVIRKHAQEPLIDR